MPNQIMDPKGGDGAEEASLPLNAGAASPDAPPKHSSSISAMGLRVLVLLAVQNASKNLLMRYVMKVRVGGMDTKENNNANSEKHTLQTACTWLHLLIMLSALFFFI